METTITAAAAQTASEVSPMDIADSAMQTAKVAYTEARKNFIALLPEATLRHMEIILKCTADGTAIPEGYQPDKYVRLTDSQRAEVKRVAEERVKWLTTNKDVVMMEVAETAGDLTGYTVRVGATKTITRLTFTKTHGEKPSAGKVSHASKVRDAFAKIAGA